MGGDQGEGHRDIHIFHKVVHIIQIIRHLFPVWLVEAGDQGVTGGKIDIVVLFLAQDTLGGGLEGDPAVPPHKLIGGVGFEVLHKLPVQQGFDTGDGELLQVAVLHLGEGAVGRDGIGHQEHPRKAQNRAERKMQYFFVMACLLSQNRK
ncbi:hypothetical protein M5E87_12755 [Flavonifractor plautii]|nr:hypothetical protein M5E87_12755 [Flavonifractor plautii]